MSQYTHIFLRKQDVFIEVSCTGRSSALSEMLEGYAPWEKLHELTYDEIGHIIGKIDGELDNWHKYAARNEKKKEFIMGSQNSLEDKLDHLADIDEALESVEDAVADLTEAKARLEWLAEMIAPWQSKPEVKAYTGCECGSDPTPDMIESR